jgi:alpha-ribazole phosphatase
MKIYVIRHTTPSVEAGICYGISDIDPGMNYEAEKRIIESKIKGFSPDNVYSSPLKRCRTLACDLFGSDSIIEDDRIKELDFGRWEMKQWDDIPLSEIDPWSADFFRSSPPEGESFGSLVARTNSFIDQVATLPHHSNIAIITHSGVIRALLMKWLAIPHTHIFNLKLDYGTVIKATITGNNAQVEIVDNKTTN